MPEENSTRRIRLVIAYDGSGYHGWQSGRSGHGVADRVQLVLAECLGVTGDIVSSSRTDSGVHAFGLVAHADVPGRHGRRSPDALRAQLNARLPADIRVREVAWVGDSFHARFGAQWKEYRYVIWNDAVMNPLMHGRAWHVPGALDIDAMMRVAEMCAGKHDFRAFTTRRKGELGSTVRVIKSVSVAHKGSEVTITLRADGFLYKMCRTLVGSMVHVGQGRMTAEQVAILLENGTGRTPGPTAPAHGLVLWKVGYGCH